jgi:hypothetical protein
VADIAVHDRCAVHPGRPAHDSCPRCGRHRCAADASDFGERGCPACAEVRRTTRAWTHPNSAIAAGLAGVPVVLIGGWIASQYVDVHIFSLLVPALIGVAGTSAATSAWRAPGRSWPAVGIGALAGVLGTALGFRLYPHGPHDPLRPWRQVALPYLCAAVAAVVWPFILGPPRRRDGRADDA